MDSGKDPLFLPYTYTPSVVRCISYYACNIIRDEKLWFSKRGWKVHLFCKNHVIITYWLKKKDMKIHTFEVLIFWKRTVTVNLKNLSSLGGMLFGNFTLSNSIVLVEGLIRWKRWFEIWWFFINYCAGYIGN